MREEHLSVGREALQIGHSEQSGIFVLFTFPEHPLHMLWH